MIRMHPLVSGSKANAVFVSTDRTRLLVDCGLPSRRLYPLLSPHCSPAEIDAVVLTHEHADHSAGIQSFAREFNAPVFMSPGTFDAIPWNFLPKVAESTVGDIIIYSVKVSHDAADPRGFVFISEDGDIVAYFVDLGVFPDDFVKQICGVRQLMLESNHDEEMLLAGPHHPKVKERCLGPLGHLSNNQVADFIAHDMPDNVERLILGHISGVANDPKLAYAVAKRAVDRRGLKCSVEVACA